MNDGIKDVEHWVTVKDVCEHLGVSRHTINNWIAKLNMPARKIGGCWRFKISEVDEWIKKQNDE